MSNQEKTAKIVSLAAALVTAAGKQYAAIAPFWPFATPQGKLTLYDVAEAAGLSKDDVHAACPVRIAQQSGRQFYRVPTGIAGKTRKTAAGKTAAAAAFLAGTAGTAAAVPQARLVRPGRK